jgi:hypothetical protein
MTPTVDLPLQCQSKMHLLLNILICKSDIISFRTSPRSERTDVPPEAYAPRAYHGGTASPPRSMPSPCAVTSVPGAPYTSQSSLKDKTAISGRPGMAPPGPTGYKSRRRVLRTEEDGAKVSNCCNVNSLVKLLSIF